MFDSKVRTLILSIPGFLTIAFTLALCGGYVRIFPSCVLYFCSNVMDSFTYSAIFNLATCFFLRWLKTLSGGFLSPLNF